MKISILIIAHNEAASIGQCLASACNQTVPADEIILVAHNCTDATASIAKDYPAVTIVEYNGPSGIVAARLKGFETVTGDIVVCTDGDSTVSPEWVRSMTEPFKDSSIAGVGSNVHYVGNLLLELAFLKYRLIDQSKALQKNKLGSNFFIGPSMAFRKAGYETVGGLEPYLELEKKLGLAKCADDVYLALSLSKHGKLRFIQNSLVTTKLKEKTIWEGWKRLCQNDDANKKLFSYFGIKK